MLGHLPEILDKLSQRWGRWGVPSTHTFPEAIQDLLVGEPVSDKIGISNGLEERLLGPEMFKGLFVELNETVFRKGTEG